MSLQILSSLARVSSKSSNSKIPALSLSLSLGAQTRHRKRKTKSVSRPRQLFLFSLKILRAKGVVGTPHACMHVKETSRKYHSIQIIHAVCRASEARQNRRGTKLIKDPPSESILPPTTVLKLCLQWKLAMQTLQVNDQDDPSREKAKKSPLNFMFIHIDMSPYPPGPTEISTLLHPTTLFFCPFFLCFHLTCQLDLFIIMICIHICLMELACFTYFTCD